jgi:hypothetical protein
MRQFRECTLCGIWADTPRQYWAFWPSAAWREYLSSKLWGNRRGPLLIWACKLLRKLLPHTPPPPQIFSVATQSRGKNRVRYSHSTGVLDMKTSFYEKVYKIFFKELGKAVLQFLKFKNISTNNKVTTL